MQIFDENRKIGEVFSQENRGIGINERPFPEH